ncbi:restriction endonuclease [Streptomyces sp. NPDC018584]|uniref:restriction endonuclease n=1 Tax=unclassified Streptomyces TaxID=2593676 RepID=UPI0037997C5A
MDIAVGAEVRRRELHARYGGSRQSGISHSRSAPVVMCFTDPKKGALYGYRDGWGADGLFHYTGEGQVGDQRMTNGNKAILNHVADQRELHVFETVRSGVVAYRGRYELPDQDAWYRAEALDREDNPRSVIIFKLKPQSFAPPASEPRIVHTPATTTTVSDVPPEEFLTTRTFLTPSPEPTVAHRRESALLASYRAHLEAQGHSLSRKRITPRGERRSLYTDLFDLTENLLIEAKGQSTRESIRMAIGQLFDYQRYIEPSPRLAVLVPTRPREDLRDLCASLAIHSIWPDEQSGEYHIEPSIPELH